MNATVTKITVARLYNLGNYEHVRYELTADVPPESGATGAMIALEKILEGMRPVKGVMSLEDLKRKQEEINLMKTMPAVEWERRYGHYAGTPTEIIARFEESLKDDTERREKAVQIAQKARLLLDNLGGAAVWADAKLGWEDEQDETQ